MMKCYYLSSCSTCRRIINTLGLKELPFEFQDIKNQPLTDVDIDKLSEIAGGYEKLLNRRARKYRELGLKEKKLSEKEIRDYLRNGYTLLKRPAIVVNDRLFMGNSKKTIEQIKKYLDEA
ncbi:MAG: arsenate reductase [Bacteroidetes bacterium]|jgi:arsenate reductase|nr:arsenate reductase [Bacteroidota bacterium]